MKEKIKIICLVLISLALLVFIAKEIIYLNAYKDCLKRYKAAQDRTWICISILNRGISD